MAPHWRRRHARFIPACAGNTAVPRNRCRDRAVHPRVRGEHCGRTSCTSRRPVHPRVRGEHQPNVRSNSGLLSVHPRVRGEHPSAARQSRCAPVHPRVRGEHEPASPGAAGGGSSPRARGTQRLQLSFPRPGRFIPACAGNTDDLADLKAAVAVHPRVRGEHANAGYTDVRYRGSSPRARGTPQADVSYAAHSRFIPACAGNTLNSSYSGGASAGSSPRARGTRRSAERGSRCTSVHPRVRGEHMACPQ